MPGPNLLYFEAVYSTYDPITGSLVSSTPTVPASSIYGNLPTILSVNRTTQTVIGVVYGSSLMTISGTTPTFGTATVASDATGVCIDDTGNIFTAMGPSSASTYAFQINTTINSAPTVSDPWPGAGGYPACIDVLGTDVYAVDTSPGGGLYVMSEPGTTIALADGTVTPVNTVTNGPSLIADPTNSGLWLLYSSAVHFWNPIGPTTTAIPTVNSLVHGFCLDETAANVVVLVVNNTTSNYHIMVVSTTTLTVTHDYDTGLVSTNQLCGCVAAHSGYAWLTNKGGLGFSIGDDFSTLYQVNLSTGAVASFDKSTEYSSYMNLGGIQPLLSIGGDILVCGVIYNLAAHGTGVVSGFDLTDSSQNFVTDGVASYSSLYVPDLLSQNLIGSVSPTIITTDSMISPTGSQAYLALNPFNNFDFSFDPDPVYFALGTLGSFNIDTSFFYLADTITSFSIVSGAYPSAVLTVSGLPATAGSILSATLTSDIVADTIGVYPLTIQGTGTFSGAVTETLIVVLYPQAEISYITKLLDGDDLSPSLKHAEVVLKLGTSGSTTHYLLRASCSAAMGGYIYWENTTGDNINRPTCSGTLGPTYIVAFWPS